MTTAELIRAMRERAGMTQGELAKLLGYTQGSTVSSLEGARRENTSTTTIRRVAKACGVGVKWTRKGGWEILSSP